MAAVHCTRERPSVTWREMLGDKKKEESFCDGKAVSCI